MIDFQKYETEIIRLSELRSSDSKKLLEWINDPELVYYSSPYKPIDDLSHNEWFNSIRKSDSVRIFSIRQKTDDALIGTCQLHSIHWISRTAELQIRIGRVENQSKGVGTQAVRLLLLFGFTDLGLNKIYLTVFSDNVKAIRVYEKNGMTRDGLLRQHVYIDGKFRDVIVMSILKSEFRHLESNNLK